MKRRWLLSILTLLLLTGCAPRRAQAQFIGYTSPQSVTEKPFNAATCVAGPTAINVSNLGQTQHQITLTYNTGGITAIQARLEGIDGNGSGGVISDVLTGQGVAFGNGYFPIIRVSVTCRGSGTFTISYTGTSSSSQNINGTALASTVNKGVISGASAGSSLTATGFVPPFGNSNGYLVFTYTGAGPAASQLQIDCGNGDILSIGTSGTTSLAYSLATTANLVQRFRIPPSPCTLLNLTYTSGGASASTYNLTYSFLTPGTPAMPYASFNPTQLGVNALTEPAGGTSALSNIIDTRGAKQATISFNCSAGAVTLNVQEYAEDEVTTLALVSPLSAVGAATNAQLTIGSESNPSSNVGTLSTTALVRFPQSALAFSFTNAGGAGTCMARLSLSY